LKEEELSASGFSLICISFVEEPNLEYEYIFFPRKFFVLKSIS